MNRFCGMCLRSCGICLWTGVCLTIGSGALADNRGEVDVEFDDLGRSPPGPIEFDAPDGEPRDGIDFRAGGDVDVVGVERAHSAGENALHRTRLEDRCLRITGTAADSLLALRLRAGVPSILEVDIGNDGQPEFSFDRGGFDCIVIDALAGDDEIVIDEVNGVFTDDELTTVNGGKGDDSFFAGSGGETFDGGPGSDSAFLGAGNDRFIWNDRDGTDLIEGSDGVDTVIVNGGDDGEQFTVTANGARVRFDRTEPAPMFLDIGTCEKLVLNANGGDDALACTGNLAALIELTAGGGPGNDTLLGGNGADVLIGGAGSDFIDGNQGVDKVFLGAGDDVFQWDPGDGSDVVEGQGGHDAVVFNGSNGSEIFDFSANGARLRFTRNLGNVVLDAAGIERFDLRALGAADAVTVSDLSGTELIEANVDLAGALGGTSGDAQPDVVTLVGTAGADTFDITADGEFVVAAMGADVRVRGYEAADQIVVNGVGGDVVNVNGSDGPDAVTITANGTQARVDANGWSLGVGVSGAVALAIRTLGGPDTVSCAGNLAALVPITIDGGPGDDTLLGGNGADVLIGGPDNDFIDGNQGVDTALLGAGDDVFQWDPGDGNDVVEGEGGHDVLVFNGSAANEIFELSANGGRLLFTRNVGAIVLDAAGIERFDLRALGGADAVTVSDLSGTELIEANVDLAGVVGGTSGDAQADVVTVVGTPGPDAIHIGPASGAVEVSGLTAELRIAHPEGAGDRLIYSGNGSADTITVDPGTTALIMLIINQ